MDKVSFGMRVRAARRKTGISSDKLSEICDCSPVSIRQIESGVRLPSVPKLVNLCNALQTTPNHLLGPELDFTPDSVMDNESQKRLARLSARIQSLPQEKFDSVCSVTETLLVCLEKL